MSVARGCVALPAHMRRRGSRRRRPDTRRPGEGTRSGKIAGLVRDAGPSRESLFKAVPADGNPIFATALQTVHAVGIRPHIA